MAPSLPSSAWITEAQRTRTLTPQRRPASGIGLPAPHTPPRPSHRIAGVESTVPLARAIRCAHYYQDADRRSPARAGSAAACVSEGVSGDGQIDKHSAEQLSPQHVLRQDAKELCTPPAPRVPWLSGPVRPPSLKRRRREQRATRAAAEDDEWAAQQPPLLGALPPLPVHPLAAPSPATSAESWQPGPGVARRLNAVFDDVSSSLVHELLGDTVSTEAVVEDAAESKNICRTSRNNDRSPPDPSGTSDIGTRLPSFSARDNSASPATPETADSPQLPSAKRQRRSRGPAQKCDATRALDFAATPPTWPSFSVIPPAEQASTPARQHSVTQRRELLFTRPLPSLEIVLARAASAKGASVAAPATHPTVLPSAAVSAKVDRPPRGSFIWTSPTKAAAMASHNGRLTDEPRQTPLRHMR
mmetsp:Transcript_31316/g.78466  ORF Transcript_31316/g.78466 Transcript_31316/m.78466 type:complete len:416 (-) Transcript_31316:55-1302(-)